jgi:hypothetical protein
LSFSSTETDDEVRADEQRPDLIRVRSFVHHSSRYNSIKSAT